MVWYSTHKYIKHDMNIVAIQSKCLLTQKHLRMYLMSFCVKFPPDSAFLRNNLKLRTAVSEDFIVAPCLLDITPPLDSLSLNTTENITHIRTNLTRTWLLTSLLIGQPSAEQRPALLPFVSPGPAPSREAKGRVAQFGFGDYKTFLKSLSTIKKLPSSDPPSSSPRRESVSKGFVGSTARSAAGEL